MRQYIETISDLFGMAKDLICEHAGISMFSTIFLVCGGFMLHDISAQWDTVVGQRMIEQKATVTAIDKCQEQLQQTDGLVRTECAPFIQKAI